MQVAELREAHAGCGEAAAAAAREVAALRQTAAQLTADRQQAAANLRRAENEVRATEMGLLGTLRLGHCFKRMGQPYLAHQRCLLIAASLGFLVSMPAVTHTLLLVGLLLLFALVHIA